MRSAPEMVPSLDDALLALDGFPGRVPDIGLAVRFLEQLNGVRDVPAVIPDQLQAAALEGAYQAGFRCADESGHVLVVSLPALLAYADQLEHAGRLARLEAGWLAPFGRFARWVGALPARLFRPTASTCTQDCNQGRACTCQPLRVAPIPPASGCSYPECFCSFEKMVAGCKTRPAK